MFSRSWLSASKFPLLFFQLFELSRLLLIFLQFKAIYQTGRRLFIAFLSNSLGSTFCYRKISASGSSPCSNIMREKSMFFLYLLPHTTRKIRQSWPALRYFALFRISQAINGCDDSDSVQHGFCKSIQCFLNTERLVASLDHEPLLKHLLRETCMATLLGGYSFGQISPVGTQFIVLLI